MSKQLWLKLLLVIHFLPWPGSGLLYSAIFADESVAVQGKEESTGTSGRSSSQELLIVHNPWPCGEQSLVYCEICSEAKELEGESKEGRADDSQDVFLVSCLIRSQQIAALMGRPGFQSELTLFDSKHQSFVILRC